MGRLKRAAVAIWRVLRPLTRPYLDLYLDLGFAMVQTQIMAERWECRERVYIALRWRVLKWQGQFRLYSPDLHRHGQ